MIVVPRRPPTPEVGEVLGRWLDTVWKSFEQGTYTPTPTNVANLDASTAYECQYQRVGDMVTVSGRVDMDPTAINTLTRLGLTLPIPSNFAGANVNELAGTAAATNSAGLCAAVVADITNDRAEFFFNSGLETTNRAFFFIFMYRVL